MTERPAPRDKSIQVHIHETTNTRLDGTKVNVKGLLINDQPNPTTIDIFSPENEQSRIIAENPIFSLSLRGEPRLQN